MLGGDLRCKSLLVYLNTVSISHSRPSTVHLERKGFIPEEVVRFWVAELSSALEYLHRQKIIHRWVSILFLSAIDSTCLQWLETRQHSFGCNGPCPYHRLQCSSTLLRAPHAQQRSWQYGLHGPSSSCAERVHMGHRLVESWGHRLRITVPQTALRRPQFGKNDTSYPQRSTKIPGRCEHKV